MINIWTQYIQHPRPGVGGLLSSSSILPQYNKCDSHDTAIIMVQIITMESDERHRQDEL